MKCPLILSADDGLYVFQSEGDLIRYVEPIDVANGEYAVYDSDGRLLSLSVEKTTGSFRIFKSQKVVLGESETLREEELRSLLTQHLKRLGKGRKDDGELDLQSLIQRVADIGR